MSARDDEKRLRIERIVPLHAPALLAYFLRRVTQTHDAADLLSETVLIVWKRSAALPSNDDEVRPWMFGIARNVLMHHQRSSIRRQAVADRLRNQLSASANPGFTDASEFDDLHDALRLLDQTDRDIIGLVHWEGFSLVEVSRIMRIKEGTLRSRYHRARSRLRDELTRHESPSRSASEGSLKSRPELPRALS